MAASQKIAISLLISVLLFGVFSALAFTGFSDLTLFSFPLPMEIIFLLFFFLMIFLIIFLLISLRQKQAAITRNQRKQLNGEAYDSTGKPSFLKKASVIVNDSDIIDRNDVIEEREGVPFISGNVLKSGQKNANALNKDFKDLVDSVI